MNDILTKALLVFFDGVFTGPNGDYPSMMEALDGVAAEQAARTPGPAANSIWRIVDHITASKLWQVEVLERGTAAPPQWTQPAGSEREWYAALARLRESHARLLAAIACLTDSQLQAVPDPADGRTQWELLLSTAAHEAAHAGQIDYLKGMPNG